MWSPGWPLNKDSAEGRERGGSAGDPDPAKYPAPGLEEEPEARERGDEDEQLLLFAESFQEQREGLRYTGKN